MDNRRHVLAILPALVSSIAACSLLTPWYIAEPPSSLAAVQTCRASDPAIEERWLPQCSGAPCAEQPDAGSELSAAGLALLNGDEKDGDEKEEDEKKGEEKNEDESGPDRLWGAVKLG